MPSILFVKEARIFVQGNANCDDLNKSTGFHAFLNQLECSPINAEKTPKKGFYNHQKYHQDLWKYIQFDDKHRGIQEKNDGDFALGLMVEPSKSI